MYSTIVLDVGGVTFRVSKSTLTHVDSYFSRLISDAWSEGVDSANTDDFLSRSHSSENRTVKSVDTKQEPASERTIFIDRDPTCFPSILTYLRCLKLYFTPDIQTVYLHQLYDEADYYMLSDLQELISAELERRDAAAKQREEADTNDRTVASDVSEIFKVVAPSQLQAYFDRGYAFVSAFQANNTAACATNSSRTWREAEHRNGACSACGESMVFDKFVKHTTSVAPTLCIVKRSVGKGVSHYPEPTLPLPLQQQQRVSQGNIWGDASPGFLHPPLSPRVAVGQGISLRNTPGQFNLDASF